MSKDDFEKLPDSEKVQLITNAICYIIIHESYFPLNVLDKKDEVETIKIVLGKYMNEEIKLK